MSKFLHYINEILVSLDIPALKSIDDKVTYKGLKKSSDKSKAAQ